jgi:aspartyl-tRNA(Asn)/glutamyl-tRNA(Gln) amidotransferase subunit A
LPIAELLARYRRKDLSPVEMLRAVLDQIDRNNGVVNAYCWLDREGALRSARDSEARWRAGAPQGLIDGVPVGIKDNILVAGMPARFGSKLTSDAPAAHDAPQLPGWGSKARSLSARPRCPNSAGRPSPIAR